MRKQRGAYFVTFTIGLIGIFTSGILALSIFDVWMVNTELDHGVIVGGQIAAQNGLVDPSTDLEETVKRSVVGYLRNDQFYSNLVITPVLTKCKNNRDCRTKYMTATRFEPYTQAKLSAQVTVNNNFGEYAKRFDADEKTDVSDSTYVRLAEPIAIDVYVIADMSGSMQANYHGQKRIMALKQALSDLAIKLEDNNKNQVAKNRLAFIGYSDRTVDAQGDTYQYTFDFQKRHLTPPAEILYKLTHQQLTTPRGHQETLCDKLKNSLTDPIITDPRSPEAKCYLYHTLPLDEDVQGVVNQVKTFWENGSTSVVQGIVEAGKVFYAAHQKRHNQIFIIVSDGVDSSELGSNLPRSNPLSSSIGRLQHWGFCRKLRKEMEKQKDFNHNAYVKTAFYAIRISDPQDPWDAALNNCVDKVFNPQNTQDLSDTFDNIVNNVFSGGVYNH